ncbi:HET-domain-containing protein [Ophiobolus disseminans]|uniref:HET-domain-containing protein n=1 Tax=Ophiobolus disseminans TaxID=1469910 RepID=A0A6A6ZE37_9PLEO|nr:HET-domain-containing protein [Ophiobolus disseminans]
MRLLYLKDKGDLGWTVDFIRDNDIPEYAILSHTWEEGQEVTFDDLKHGHAKEKAGYKKLELCARQAAQDGWKYFWVDTCCIDKSNSTELSEAINSMFRWYQRATVCYVYLSDFSSGHSEWNRSLSPAIKKCKWFTRGWTLQELIAPLKVDFFSKEWTKLGNKQSLAQTLHERTGIALQALEGNPMTLFPVEERMSWVTGRETTRAEDAAYCLLGIFDVQIPLLYGEGQQRAINRLRREIKEQYCLNIPIALGATYDSYAEEHNARCLPNTRTTLLQNIAHWAEGEDEKPVFWLSGMAGTGKSTIARTAAHLFAQAGQLGASFFFKKGEGERSNASRFFSTVASSLAACQPAMLPGIRKALEEDPALLSRALKDQFEKLIMRPLANIQNARPHVAAQVIVIDALDECEREDDVRAILQLLGKTRDTDSVRLRVLVTSRPELHIRLGFRQMSNGMYQDLVLHEVPMSVVKHDIRCFLKHELGSIQQARSLSSNWPTEEQVQALVELSVPLFIFAATVCRYVGTKGGDPKTYLNKILQYRKATFSQLDRTYLPVLEQILTEQEDDDDQETWLDNFRSLVGSIVVLESPLSVVALSSLLRIPQEQIECRLDALHSVLNIPSDRRLSVRLLHLSFRDFLVVSRQQTKNPFQVNQTIVHGKLASHCLELMSAPNGLRQNICNLSEPGVLSSEVDESQIKANLPPELQYACRYWVDHLERSQRGIKDGEATHRFLQKHLLHWLEAMSLINETSLCIRLVARLQGLATPSDSAVASFLRDASRFALRFVPILAEAPLQIYSSALLFSPEASIVRKAFIEQIPQIVKVLSGRDANWDACRSVLEGHSEAVNAVVFSPDGQLLASASDDSTVRVWETATGQCRSGHSGDISAVVFSPDGQLLASASTDCTVRVWETATGQCRSVLEGQPSWILRIAFLPDSRTLRTNRGDISLPSGSIAALAPLQAQEPSCTTIESEWIVRRTRRFLWLPPEYRNCTTAVHEYMVCLGCSSGRVSLLSLQ